MQQYINTHTTEKAFGLKKKKSICNTKSPEIENCTQVIDYEIPHFQSSAKLSLILNSCPLDCSLCCLNYAGIPLQSVSPKLTLVLEKIACYSYIINYIV